MRIENSPSDLASLSGSDFLVLLDHPAANVADDGPCEDLQSYKDQQAKTWHWEYPEPVEGMKIHFPLKPYKMTDNQAEYDRLQLWIDYLTPKCAAERSSSAPTPTPQTKPSNPAPQPRRSGPPIIID